MKCSKKLYFSSFWLSKNGDLRVPLSSLNTGTSGSNLTGTAIEIDGQDHWISDVIVFSARFGIVLNGGALVLTNTHIYNGGEEGLRIVGAATRVLGCYFDNGDGTGKWWRQGASPDDRERLLSVRGV